MAVSISAYAHRTRADVLHPPKRNRLRMRESSGESHLIRQEPVLCRRARSRFRCVMLALIYIEARFRHPMSLEAIARASHMSRFHFARAFRAETGMSTMQYVRWRRVHEAKRLLRTGGIPLATIATDLGYFDQSHFTRAFRSVTGLRPHEYLNEVARPELNICTAVPRCCRGESTLNFGKIKAHIVD